MRAEIISIGTELTSGSKLDTNSQWLDVELSGLGLPVLFHTTVVDELPHMTAVFREAARRSDVVIVSGGLGPTRDDLTRDALAMLTGTALELHEPSLEHLRNLFTSRGRVMPERNVVQATFPAGSEPIPNPLGTAPGIWLEVPRADGKCLVAALPGVPSEMKPMFREFVAPRLRSVGRVIRHFRVNCFGAGESAVEERLGELTARGRDPEVGITAHEATITLRIIACGGTGEECERKANAVKSEIRARLGELVYGEEDDELQDVVVKRLRDRGETLAVIENGLTGGRMTEWLTAVRGSADVFRGGLTLVTPGPMLARLLEQAGKGAGSGDLRNRAREEAEKARQYAEATWGIAVIGGAVEEGRPPRGGVAVVGPDCVLSMPYRSFGDAAIDRSRAVKTALDLLRRQIERAS